MKDSIRNKLDTIAARHEEVGVLLSDPDVMADQNKFRELGKEYSQLQPVVDTWVSYQKALSDIEDAKEMLADPDMKELAEMELDGADERIAELDITLQTLLLPKDPRDESNIYLEVRAGTGGDEAAIFAGDLFRMYSRFAENQRWQVEIVNENKGEHGGYKEVVARVIGNGVFSRFKFESGAHRVQRVPETETQGRVHTSACTVAILPEAPEAEEIEINPADLRVDTFRASGAGGQHVNKTDSAIRLTHKPSGLVVECQEERSQHKNRAKAMSLLKTKLNDIETNKAHEENSEARRLQVGSGDRSERIRTYNYPQGRVTDHRINLTLYKLDEIMQGRLEQVLDPLAQEHQADQLAALGAND